MQRHRLIASALTAAVALSAAAPAALAMTSDEVIALQKEFKANDMCADKTQRLRGKCIGDVIKRIKSLRDEFRDALEDERKAWYDANSYLGVSTEYTSAIQKYTQDVLAKRKVFNDQQREIEKKFFDEQKAFLKQNGGSTGSGYTRPVTKTDLETATQKCAKQKDASGLRVCLRTQLRLSDPNARQMGAGLRSVRGQ